MVDVPEVTGLAELPPTGPVVAEVVGVVTVVVVATVVEPEPYPVGLAAELAGGVGAVSESKLDASVVKP
jgi:hypothetical protein